MQKESTRFSGISRKCVGEATLENPDGFMRQQGANETFKPGPRGLEFKNGKLYQFAGRHVVVMRPWPQPMAWCKRCARNWQPTRRLADDVVSAARFFDVPVLAPVKPSLPFALPDGQLTLPGVTHEEWIATRLYKDEVSRLHFVNLVPAEVRQELARYRSRRWHLLSVFARCPGALDLSRSNPALLFALASNWVFHKPVVSQPIRAARGLVNRKQRVIQAWLEFPDSETVRRILAKIDPAALSVRRLFFLRSALADPVCVRLLQHLPRINELALVLVSPHRLRARITPRLLQEAIECEKDGWPISGTWRCALDPIVLVLDTMRMCTAVGWEHCPKRLHSLGGIHRLHDALVPRMREAFRRGEAPIAERLPAPPFAGTADIVPLTTVEALIQEGLEQHHCAAARAPLVAQGRQYLYSVRQPVRGTLSVYFNGLDWFPGEFRLACNKAVPQKMRTLTFTALLADKG